jgi:soluble lytic murein transglycosylase-like protein
MKDGLAPPPRLRRAAVLALCLAAGPAWAQLENPALSYAHAVALRTQAVALEHGEGVAKDLPKAAERYCEAARLGDPEAQFNLGWMHANGRGLPRNDALAGFFFRAAAEQGHEQAARMLRHVGEPVASLPECMREKALAESGPESEKVFVPATVAQRKVVDLVSKLGPQYGVSPQLALAVIRAESNFQSGARSPKNAQGLMQLIPETAERFNVKKPFDPAQNIRGGLAYLRWLLAYFRGDVELVAAGYNAGEGAVNRYRGVPPYAETRAYVKRIRALFGKARHAYDDTVTAASPELFRISVAKAR